MIILPPSVVKRIYQVNKNSVWRCYTKEDINIDNTNKRSIASRDPFIIEQEGRRILLTSNRNITIPEDCPFALLINKQINSASFERGDFRVLEWLKHPAINDDLTSDEVTASWRNKFTYIQEDKEAGVPGLREPQLAAIHAYLSKRYTLRDRANIVMPTGTGKTETMLGIMIAAQCRKILVSVPHDALREQLFRKFLTLGCLHQFGIVAEDCKYPYVSFISTGMALDGWREIVSRSNVIITTMPLLAQTDDDVRAYLTSVITHVFVDEAHHSEAETWSKFLGIFNKKPIVQFTATPFRNDGRKMRGDFIYSFSLRSAQQQGYYQHINFNPVYEIDKNKADEAIAHQAVEILRRDLAAGYDHILMARCKDKNRAEQVFEHYRSFEDLNPIVIHSSKPAKTALIDEIKRGEHKIVVCVNMLGEGFDLPQLKVAAIHDERQSLPVTLQFIGRFTRTTGFNIGEASFVTNMAYPPMAEEIRDLYLKDADWNIIIPGLNDRTTDDEVAFADLINEFPNVDNSEIPFQSINPALSTVIYRLNTMTWNTDNWQSVYTEKDFDYRYADVNESGDMLVIILGHLEGLEWSNYEGLQNRLWDVILLYKYDAGSYKHLYINSSIKGANFDTLVEVLFGSKQFQLSGDIIFRSFHGIHRLLVQNFGGRQAMFGDVSFKSYVGRDVENGVNEASQGKLRKNNVFAVGTLNGDKVTHGCSMKGKIWSYRRGNLLSFKRWSEHVGSLVEDPTIPTDELFKHTLTVRPVNSSPNSVPIGIDWDDDVYKNIDYEQILSFDGNEEEINVFDISLEITQRDWNLRPLPSDILFDISYGELRSQYRISYSSAAVGGETQYNYAIEKVYGSKISFRIGKNRFDDIIDYFQSENRSPMFFFSDGSMLYANNLVELRQLTTPFDPNNLQPLEWEGVDLNVESMDWPRKQNSIQYYVWQKINDDYDLIFDDDGSGEIADLVAVNQDDKTIYIDLYHLKYAAEGIVSGRIGKSSRK